MPALLNVFGDIERAVADLYPHRFVITPLLIAAAAATVYLAYRQGLHLVLLRHRLATALVGVPMLVIVVLAGDYFLSPLWERSHLEEASPLEAAALQTPADASPAAGATAAPTATASSEPMITHRGEFHGADSLHFGRGTALIIATEAGNVLRFEDFSVLNGPDLFVYLSTDPAGETVEESLNLGSLKATDGAFNYDIPDDIDLDSIASVVVWCRQFSVLFAAAPLTQ